MASQPTPRVLSAVRSPQVTTVFPLPLPIAEIRIRPGGVSFPSATGTVPFEARTSPSASGTVPSEAGTVPTSPSLVSFPTELPHFGSSERSRTSPFATGTVPSEAGTVPPLPSLVSFPTELANFTLLTSSTLSPLNSSPASSRTLPLLTLSSGYPSSSPTTARSSPYPASASSRQILPGVSFPPVRKNTSLPFSTSLTGSHSVPCADTRFQSCQGFPILAASSWTLESPGSTRNAISSRSKSPMSFEAPE